jgi:enoyl-CoA hydratase/carnithine racemase
MLVVGHRLSAEEAWRIGLVNRVVPASELMDIAFEVARLIEQNAPLAVQAVKDAAYRGMDMTLQGGLRYEQLNSKLLSFTEDAKEGPRAFAQKCAPRGEDVDRLE